MRTLAIAAAIVGLGTAAIAAVHGTRHLWTRWQPGRPHGAPDAQAHPGPSAGTTARIVMADTMASLWLGLAALRPRRLPLGRARAGRPPVLVLGPSWLPRRTLSVLGHRLARTGTLVGLARMPRHATPSAIGRIAAAAERLARCTTLGCLDLVAYDAAARALRALLPLLAPGTVRRVVVLGARIDARDGHPTPTVTILARHDPWLGGPDPGKLGGPRIEIDGIGHLSLLVAPLVVDLIDETCADAAADPGATR